MVRLRRCAIAAVLLTTGCLATACTSTETTLVLTISMDQNDKQIELKNVKVQLTRPPATNVGYEKIFALQQRPDAGLDYPNTVQRIELPGWSGPLHGFGVALALDNTETKYTGTGDIELTGDSVNAMSIRLAPPAAPPPTTQDGGSEAGDEGGSPEAGAADEAGTDAASSTDATVDAAKADSAVEASTTADGSADGSSTSEAGKDAQPGTDTGADAADAPDTGADAEQDAAADADHE